MFCGIGATIPVNATL